MSTCIYSTVETQLKSRNNSKQTELGEGEDGSKGGSGWGGGGSNRVRA